MVVLAFTVLLQKAAITKAVVVAMVSTAVRHFAKERATAWL